ncbi:hypothetical protein HBB16_01910 [Pseudonocardia sp. MCCB 268]|nr:hypothetical protein [Pseudonocardia cytotoxica]
MPRTDFSRVWARSGARRRRPDPGSRRTISARPGWTPATCRSAAGNFAGELYLGQGHLGGLLVEPTRRSECRRPGTSGLRSAVWLLCGDGRHRGRQVRRVALVVGGDHATAAVESHGSPPVPGCRATEGVERPVAAPVQRGGYEYDRRYGLDHRYLGAIAANNLANAGQNLAGFVDPG